MCSHARVPVGCQVVFRAVDDLVLAPSAEKRREFASVMLRVGRPHGLFAFGVADTHGHAALALAAAGRFVHDAKLALARALELELVTPTISVIRDTWHAEKVIAYVHRQDEKHGSNLDPLREGTSLHPLLGLVPDGAWIADRVRKLAPRVQRADLLAQLGVLRLDEALSLPVLADAAAATVGVATLDGNGADVVRARLAAVHGAAEIPAREVAAALGVTDRTVRKLREREPEAALVRAVRLQVGLRLALAGKERLDFLGESATM